MPTITLRDAFIDDVEGIAKAHRDTWRTTYQGILPAPVIESTTRRYPTFWTQSIQEKRFQVLLAETEDSDIVGFIAYGKPREKGVSFDIEIYSLYVIQPFQRHGIGRALLAEVARRIVREGQFSLYLWALKANPARLFYEANGGDIVAQRTESFDGHAMVEVAYGWSDLSRFINPRRPKRGAHS
jgi:GNAT superfamily N-acetyltransferase